jgi:RimJ/RimL family protein N-acetyltransferase
VTLRRPRIDDVDQIVAGCTDPLTKRFTSSIPDPYGEADARHWIASSERRLDESVDLAIVDAADEARLLGMIGIHDVSWRDRRANAGYWVAAEARGNGHAVRALKLLCDWAFAELGFVRIGLIADVENTGSHRVAEKAGFTREGTLARHTIMAGEHRDVAIFGLVR